MVHEIRPGFVLIEVYYIQQGFVAFHCLQTTIPPASQYYFGYGPRANSFVYLAIGIESLFVYVIFYVLVKRISERVMLVGSCVLMIIGCTFALVVSTLLRKGEDMTLKNIHRDVSHMMHITYPGGKKVWNILY